MTGAVAVLVPVLGRPHRVKPLVRSISTATPEPHSILFICDPGDRATQDAVAMAGCRMISPGGTYATKIRAGVEATREPLVFTAADDIVPERGWLPAAAAHLGNGVEVVGVNDLIERTRDHATHFLMTREYAHRPTIDGQPGPFSAVYSHSFCDDELIATARKRGVYAYAQDARVRHEHPMNGTAEDDDTYRKGRAQFRQDRRLHRRRTSLWT